MAYGAKGRAPPVICHQKIRFKDLEQGSPPLHQTNHQEEGLKTTDILLPSISPLIHDSDLNLLIFGTTSFTLTIVQLGRD